MTELAKFKARIGNVISTRDGFQVTITEGVLRDVTIQFEKDPGIESQNMPEFIKLRRKVVTVSITS